MDPGTAMIIAAAVAATAQGAGSYFGGQKQEKAASRRAYETKRETVSDLFNQALNRRAELEATRLASSERKSKRKGNSMQETADLMRGAFNI